MNGENAKDQEASGELLDEQTDSTNVQQLEQNEVEENQMNTENVQEFGGQDEKIMNTDTESESSKETDVQDRQVEVEATDSETHFRNLKESVKKLCLDFNLQTTELTRLSNALQTLFESHNEKAVTSENNISSLEKELKEVRLPSHSPFCSM